jgi:hypothetical protein
LRHDPRKLWPMKLVAKPRCFIAISAAVDWMPRVSARLSAFAFYISIRAESDAYIHPDVLLCTFITPKGSRCNARYCKHCLRNRYDMNMDAIVKRGRPSSKSKELEGHIVASGYVFKYVARALYAMWFLTRVYRCPRCKDMCNCRRCRKSKGLAPTG